MKKIYLFILLFPLLLFSQQKKDIKVGLVLSGGGAKGLAHIPILKAIEKAGVRVDYIAGTSFGAMIGSLYASGYTADEIDSIAKATDFEKILSGKIHRKNKPFKYKELGKEYVISLPLVNFKIGLPVAFTYGQGIQNLMTELTKDVSHIRDFSKLPIPFLCIATNLETGKKEVLKKGFLPKAIRASAAFPGLIAPVKINEKLLIDGGVADNFPVEEVKKMGADVIIGVDIQGTLQKKDKLNSINSILNQIVSYQMYKDNSKKDKMVDILIKPRVKQYRVIDFNKIDIIIKEGAIAAEKHYDELVKLAQKQKKKKRKLKIKKENFIRIKNIKINGNKLYTDRYIKGKLELEKNDSISYKELSESINKLFSTKEFKNIQCNVKKEKDKCCLIFDVEENPVRTNVNVGVNYNNLYKTGVLLGVTSKNLLFKSDLLSTHVVLGDNIRYNFDYFIDNGLYWSLGFHSRLNTFSRNAYFEDSFVQKINISYRENINQFYAQTNFDRNFSIKIGAEHNHFKIYTNTIYSLDSNHNQSKKEKDYRLILENSNYIKGFGNITLDSYDNVNFPKEGVFFKLDGNWFLHSSSNKKFSPFFQAYGKLGFAASPLSSKLSINIGIEGGVTFGNNQNSFLNYKLGSYGHFKTFNLIPFYGYDYFDENLNAPLFVKTDATFRYEMFKKNYLKFSANSALVDKINIKNYKEHLKIGYLLGYELDSFLGPIGITYTWSPEEQNHFWYFNLGFWF